jgi:hypothetical protein
MASGRVDMDGDKWATGIDLAMFRPALARRGKSSERGGRPEKKECVSQDLAKWCWERARKQCRGSGAR